MAAGDPIHGVDVSVRKKPKNYSIHLVNREGGLKFSHIVGADPEDYQRLRQIGELLGGLLTGDITHAVVHNGGPGKQCQSTAVNTSRSNVKNN